MQRILFAIDEGIIQDAAFKYTVVPYLLLTDNTTILDVDSAQGVRSAQRMLVVDIVIEAYLLIMRLAAVLGVTRLVNMHRAIVQEQLI